MEKTITEELDGGYEDIGGDMGMYVLVGLVVLMVIMMARKNKD